MPQPPIHSSIMVAEEESKCDSDVLPSQKVDEGGGKESMRTALSSFLLVALGIALLLLLIHGPITVTRTAVAAVGTLWLASLGSGAVLQALGIPALLGSLLAGLLLRNAGGERFETSEELRKVIEAVGLAVILVLSSLEIDLAAVYRAGWLPLRLTCMPGITEASVAAGVACLVFDMPLALAFTLGFVLAAVSPAIVVPGLLALQKEGHGTSSVASLLFASCAFDDVVAILGFSVSLGVALENGSNVLLSAFMLGPVSIFFGVVAGCVGGFVLALLCKMSPNRWQRTVIALELVLILSYGFERLSFAAGSAVGTMIIGIVAKYLLGSAFAGTDGCDRDCVANLEADINTIWDVIIRPLLLGSVGANLAFRDIPSQMVGGSFAVILSALVFRLAAAYLATRGGGLTPGERTFVSLAWTPKATVQAALSSVPLSMIRSRGGSDELVVHGGQIAATATIAILLTAPLGLLSMKFLGPRLLSVTKREDDRSPAGDEDDCGRRRAVETAKNGEDCKEDYCD